MDWTELTHTNLRAIRARARPELTVAQLGGRGNLGEVGLGHEENWAVSYSAPVTVLIKGKVTQVKYSTPYATTDER